MSYQCEHCGQTDGHDEDCFVVKDRGRQTKQLTKEDRMNLGEPLVGQIKTAIMGLQVGIHTTALNSGFWPKKGRNDGECIALMHSELSEALEALRKPGPDVHCPEFKAVEVELADCMIRILDFATARNLDIAGAMLAKMEYNNSRPHKHGGKKF